MTDMLKKLKKLKILISMPDKLWKVENQFLFLAYGGLGDPSGMRDVCRCLFHADSGTSRITADHVRPATTANHSLLSNNPTYRCLVNPPN